MQVATDFDGHDVENFTLGEGALKSDDPSHIPITISWKNVRYSVFNRYQLLSSQCKMQSYCFLLQVIQDGQEQQRLLEGEQSI
jgi:hypothetical protein